MAQEGVSLKNLDIHTKFTKIYQFDVRTIKKKVLRDSLAVLAERQVHSL